MQLPINGTSSWAYLLAPLVRDPTYTGLKPLKPAAQAIVNPDETFIDSLYHLDHSFYTPSNALLKPHPCRSARRLRTISPLQAGLYEG